MQKKFVQDHISNTYFNLRMAIALLAFLLPIILFVGAMVSSLFGLQGSISGFYHTPMRNVFVGVLISAGICLYLYKGYSNRENITLNIAGVLAIGVAIFPTRIPATIPIPTPGWLPSEPFVAPIPHAVCAIAFFVAIAYVCIRCGKETLELISNQDIRANFSRIYKVLGILMILLPLLTAVLFLADSSEGSLRTYLIFAVETIAVWVFGTYWATKSYELRKHTSQSDREILLGRTE